MPPAMPRRGERDGARHGVDAEARGRRSLRRGAARPAHLQTAASSVDSLNAHVSDVQHMVESESVPMSDLLAARVALANAQQAQLRAANAVEVAQAAYNRHLGQPLERSPELDEHLPGDAALAGQPIEALVARALESRSELKGLVAQADALAAQSRAEIAKRDRSSH